MRNLITITHAGLESKLKKVANEAYQLGFNEGKSGFSDKDMRKIHLREVIKRNLGQKD